MNFSNVCVKVTCSECGERIMPRGEGPHFYALAPEHECLEESEPGNPRTADIVRLFSVCPDGSWDFNKDGFEFEVISVEDEGEP